MVTNIKSSTSLCHQHKCGRSESSNSISSILNTSKVDKSIDCSGYRYQNANNCPGIQWRSCSESGDENFDTGCDEQPDDIEIRDKEVIVPLEGDILRNFNQLSDNDLELSLGRIKTSNSLNEYMSKIDLCHFENGERKNVSATSEMLLRQVFLI